MPHLSRERILEFQKIFQEESGKELTYAQAEEAANNLVGFFDLLWTIDKRIKDEKTKGGK